MARKTPSLRPRLRAVETVVVPDERWGRALMLRDNEGVTDAVAVLPAPLVPIVALFDGRHDVRRIAERASAELGQEVPEALVTRLADELERALYLDGEAYRAERAKVEREFAAAAVRPASHAGGAYHADPDKLRAYIEAECLGAAGRSADGADGAPLVGLVAPHIDPWRGARGYGHAYGVLRAHLPAEASTFVLLGTSHAPMREPFALCRKAFDTPLGPLRAHEGIVDAVAAAAPFDAYADLFNHRREHSLEFQAVFVRHLVPDRDVRIVPVLCGLGASQAAGSDPARDEKVEAFVGALREACDREPGRVVVIAGADLAHVGPRFGDPAPYDDEQRAALERADRTSLAMAGRGEARDLFFDLCADRDVRRVCGTGPMYTLLRLLPPRAKGTLLHYEQSVDPREGSIVSHAAMGWFA